MNATDSTFGTAKIWRQVVKRIVGLLIAERANVNQEPRADLTSVTHIFILFSTSLQFYNLRNLTVGIVARALNITSVLVSTDVQKVTVNAVLCQICISIINNIRIGRYYFD